MKYKRKIFVIASGINNGGGMVLFESLVKSLQKYPLRILLDIRLKKKYINLINQGIGKLVKISFVHRIILNIKFSKAAKKGDILFSFNSLPPIFKSEAYTITYIHSPQFVGLHKNSNYRLKDRIRFLIEIVWLRLTYNNSNELWVQTSSMKKLLLKRFQNAKVKVVPFIDDKLHKICMSKNKDKINFTNDDKYFFYPAGLAGHKNHKILIEAFKKLDSINKSAKLIITIPELDFKKLANNKISSNIINLKEVKRDKVLSIMESSSALIFPSKAETFGIPLVEATALGIPVLSANLDYIDDVCVPYSKFDPYSSDSIVESVLDFLENGEQELTNKSFYQQRQTILKNLLSSDEFVTKLYTI